MTCNMYILYLNVSLMVTNIFCFIWMGMSSLYLFIENAFFLWFAGSPYTWSILKFSTGYLSVITLVSIFFFRKGAPNFMLSLFNCTLNVCVFALANIYFNVIPDFAGIKYLWWK